MPSFIRASPKFSRYPSFLFVNFRYVNNLLLMCIVEFFNRFQFQYNFVFDDNISPKSFVEPDAMEFNRDWNLSLNPQAGFPKHMHKKHLINSLKQSRAKLHVKTHGTINHDFSDFVFRHFLRAFVPSCEYGFRFLSDSSPQFFALTKYNRRFITCCKLKLFVATQVLRQKTEG